MTVHLHEEDMPAGVFAAGAAIAVDTETMGLITPRDRLCLVQLSDGGADEHLVRFGAGQRLCRAQPEGAAGRSGAGEALSFRAVRYRRDPALSRRRRGAGLLHQDRVAADAHLHRSPRPEGTGPRTARPGHLASSSNRPTGARPNCRDAQKEYAASDVRYLHRLQDELDERLAREGRMELAQACFDFLPPRAALDLAGWPEIDIFAHV